MPLVFQNEMYSTHEKLASITASAFASSGEKPMVMEITDGS